MIEVIGIAIIIGVAVGLGCMLVGGLLKSMSIPPAAAVGGFLSQYGWAIGVLVGLWWFFTHADL